MSVKISQLPAATELTSNDLFAVVDEPSTTPVTKKITAGQVLEYVTSSITELPNLVINSGTIGPAEDGDYEDGLFTSFTPSTPIGTAIDKINEVLKGLAPPAAPELTNLEKSTAGGASMRLSFGASSPVGGYTSADLGLTGLPNVDIGGTFQPISGPGGGAIRLGLFTSLANFNLLLNNTTTANAGLFTNYPDDSFNVSPDGIGTFTLEVNGASVGISSVLNTSSFSDSTFNLGDANPGAFVGTGIPFDIFRNRAGTVTIDQTDWVSGYNYAKVIHSSSLGQVETNYIDWVYDPDMLDGDNNYVFNSVTASAFTIDGLKTLSGIKYYTNITYDLTAQVDFYFRNSYPVASNGGVSFLTTTGLSAAGVTVGTPANNTSALQIDSSHTLGSIRLLGQSLSTDININNGLGKTGTVNFTTPTILLDKINTPNTNTAENFCLENFRILSGVYNTQASVTSLSPYPSNLPLQSTELAVYDGAVRYPTQVLNGGNVEGSSVVHKIASQPDYSSATEERYYFRKFVNGPSALSLFDLNITGKNIEFVPASQALTGNKVKLFIKIPGKTGWRDVNTTAGDPSEDDIGCLQGDLASPIGSTQASRTIEINLLTDGIEPGEVYLLRIQTSNSWTGYINSVQIS
jgi:hypothetical protein